MNILKKISISGEIRLSYALLSYRYTFENTADMPISPRYIFALPENGLISGLQILDESKSLSRAKIVPLQGVEVEMNTYLRQLDGQLYCLSYPYLDRGKTCDIIVDICMPCTSLRGIYRITLPLGINLPNIEKQEINSCPVDISLTVTPKISYVTSPTHQLSLTSGEDCSFIDATAKGGEDFVIDIPIAMKNCCLVQSDLRESLAFCRICTKDKDLYKTSPKEKVLFFLDLGGIIPYGTERAIKELLFRMIQVLPANTKVQVMTTSGDSTCLFDDFTHVGEDFYDSIFRMVSELSVPKRTVSELFKNMPQDDALCIMISGGLPEDPETVLRSFPSMRNIHLFTAGARSMTTFARKVKALGIGRYYHFYEADKMEIRLRNIIPDLLENSSPVRIEPVGYSPREMFVMSDTSIAVEGYQDIVISYSGKRPERFAITHDGIIKENCVIDDAEVYSHYPFIRLIFASEKTKYVQELYHRTQSQSMRRIKKQIEEIGSEYGLLNSETIFVISGKDGEIAVPVTTCSIKSDGLEEFAKRPAVISEGRGSIHLLSQKRQELLFVCKETVLEAIRSDGAIAEANCVSRERPIQTATALAGLLLIYGKKEEYKKIFEDGYEYLKDKPLHEFPEKLWRIETAEEYLRENRDEIDLMVPHLNDLIERLDANPESSHIAAQILLKYGICLFEG